MMTFNFQLAHKLIEQRKATIQSAELGLDGDWGWNHQEVYADGNYLLDLTSVDVNVDFHCSSFWATPSVEFTYLDGRTERLPCSNSDGAHSPEVASSMAAQMRVFINHP